jgi:hypothetical protein
VLLLARRLFAGLLAVWLLLLLLLLLLLVVLVSLVRPAGL